MDRVLKSLRKNSDLQRFLQVHHGVDHREVYYYIFSKIFTENFVK